MFGRWGLFEHRLLCKDMVVEPLFLSGVARSSVGHTHDAQLPPAGGVHGRVVQPGMVQHPVISMCIWLALLQPLIAAQAGMSCVGHDVEEVDVATMQCARECRCGGLAQQSSSFFLSQASRARLVEHRHPSGRDSALHTCILLICFCMLVTIDSCFNKARKW